jgi:hypothetical protein
MQRLCVAAILTLLVCGWVGQAAADVLRVGPNRALTRVSAAARLAKSGDVVEVDTGEYEGDVATWWQSNLIIRAVGGRARITQQGASAEGKAIWVIKGNDVLVENFEFAGAHVTNRNGAGIRHEGGKLTVRNCLFEKNQMGLLAWNDTGAEVVVEGSEFRDNAAAATHHNGDPIGHQIYVGTIARFTLRDSYVHRGAHGHLVKSRARESRIVNNRLTDESEGRSSYELEFPNGGIAYVLGNIIEQGAHTENRDMVAFGAEGIRWPVNELYLINNTLDDRLPAGGRFLRVWPGAGRVDVVNNLMLGRGRLEPNPDWKAAGNAVATADDVPFAANFDYRLKARSTLVGIATNPGAARGVALTPDREYSGPLQSQPVPSRTASSPGALQSLLP